MLEPEELKARIERQAEKVWDAVAIAAWLKGIADGGIPSKTPDPRDLAARKQQVLAGIQHRAEDCTYLSRI